MPHSKTNISNTSSHYYLATFGCQMNVYDSNMIASMLEKNGLTPTDTADDAAVVIVNTCSVRGGAEDRAYARIAAMRHYKKLRPDLKIAVVGCMAQNHKEKIPTSLEHVDFVVGPDNYQQLEKLLFPHAPLDEFQSDFIHNTLTTTAPEKKKYLTVTQEALDKSPYASSASKKKRIAIPILTEQNPIENYLGHTAKLDSPVSTFITIMRGCNKKCSYCIVPFVRGVERSRPPEEIVREVRAAVEMGVPEITLLGQTVNSYRIPKQTNFADLLLRLVEIDGLSRIRFTSPHPRHFTTGVIQVMANSPKICPHVHMPMQSGSDRILKSMRRQYTSAQYRHIVDELRSTIPGIAITTDIIVGYPGETEDEFLATQNMMREIEFDAAFMFAYSAREGTEAYAFPESLSETQKGQRLQSIIDLQHPITKKLTEIWIGKDVDVLLEGPSERDPKNWVGKTPHFKKVIVPYTEDMRAGQIASVHISDCKGITLVGTLNI